MPPVELIHAPDCPNVGRARRHLLEAFSRSGVAARWSEHGVGAEDAPEHARGFGSPTILVDGLDGAGVAPASDTCCRVYATSHGLDGVPPVDTIVAALLRAPRDPELRARVKPPWQGLAVLPGIGAAFLPKVACPACWPAYAGVLGSLGLGFLMDLTWLLPLTAVFLGLAVGALAFRAQSRRGYMPMALGVLAAAIVLAGKFGFDSDAAMYVGLAVLVGASVWNTWPRRQTSRCSECARTGAGEVTR